MIQEFKKIWKPYTIGLVWLLGLLWPLLGIHPDGTLSFSNTFTVWSYIAVGVSICLLPVNAAVQRIQLLPEGAYDLPVAQGCRGSFDEFRFPGPGVYGLLRSAKFFHYHCRDQVENRG